MGPNDSDSESFSIQKAVTKFAMKNLLGGNMPLK